MTILLKYVGNESGCATAALTPFAQFGSRVAADGNMCRLFFLAVLFPLMKEEVAALTSQRCAANSRAIAEED
jgi:hypothetical protein